MMGLWLFVFWVLDALLLLGVALVCCDCVVCAVFWFMLVILLCVCVLLFSASVCCLLSMLFCGLDWFWQCCIWVSFA